MSKRRLSAVVLGVVLGAAVVAPSVAQQRVSVYTAHTANMVERLIPEFEKATGLTADIVKAGSGDIINRVRAEAGNPQADVIWSIGAELLEANADLLEAYPPAGADMIDPAFQTDRPGFPIPASSPCSWSTPTSCSPRSTPRPGSIWPIHASRARSPRPGPTSPDRPTSSSRPS